MGRYCLVPRSQSSLRLNSMSYSLPAYNNRMASLDEVARLRRLTDVAEDDETYTSDLLGQLIDDLGMETAAGTVWREKAAKYAGLVDVTESGSSRRLSQLYDQALRVGQTFTPDPEDDTRGRSFTVEVERA